MAVSAERARTSGDARCVQREFLGIRLIHQPCIHKNVDLWCRFLTFDPNREMVAVIQGAVISGGEIDTGQLTEKAICQGGISGILGAATAGGSISKAIIKEELFSIRFRNLVMNVVILIVFSLVVLLIGGLVETFVLVNSDTYRLIIQQSFLMLLQG